METHINTLRYFVNEIVFLFNARYENVAINKDNNINLTTFIIILTQFIINAVPVKLLICQCQYKM